jgi:hypothetical protein
MVTIDGEMARRRWTQETARPRRLLGVGWLTRKHDPKEGAGGVRWLASFRTSASAASWCDG